MFCLVILHVNRERLFLQRSFEPTLTSWEDFELSDEDSALPDLPRKSISEGSTPWNNFKDLVIGQRYIFDSLIIILLFLLYYAYQKLRECITL